MLLSNLQQSKKNMHSIKFNSYWLALEQFSLFFFFSLRWKLRHFRILQSGETSTAAFKESPLLTGASQTKQKQNITIIYVPKQTGGREIPIFIVYKLN